MKTLIVVSIVSAAPGDHNQSHQTQIQSEIRGDIRYLPRGFILLSLELLAPPLNVNPRE